MISSNDNFYNIKSCYSITQIINIDSKYRNKSKYPNSCKFVINLKNKIKDAISIKLSSFHIPSYEEIPVIYSNINQSIKQNNSFKIIKNNITTEIIIPNDIYDYVKLIDKINQLLNETNLEIQINLNSSQYVTIASNDIFSIDFSKDNSDTNLTLGIILGFKKKYYFDILIVTGENSCEIPVDNYMLLNLNNYGYLTNSLNNDYNNDDTLLEIISFHIIINNNKYEIIIEPIIYNSVIQLIASIQNSINNYKINISIEIINNNQIKFSSNTIFDIIFNSNSTRSIQKILGFTNNSYININKVLISENNCILVNNKYFLSCNTNYLNNFNSNNHYLGKIVYYNNKSTEIISQEYKFPNPTNLNYLDIEIHNPYMEILNLGNINYSFTLDIVSQYYK